MILLAAAFVAGDSWSWDVTLRYESPADALTITEKERWTLRVGPKDTLTGERKYLGSLIDGELIPSADNRPENIKGVVEKDGTLTLKPDWSDPAATRAFRKLLNPDKKLDDRLKNWPLVRHAILRDPDTKLPGSNIPVTLTVEATLSTAHLSGQDIKIKG